MNVSRILTSLTRQGRQLSTNNVLLQENKRQQRLKELQKLYQIDDGVPVYLKGGAKDRILYVTTVGLCVVGVVYSVYTIYTLIFPKKKE